MYNLMVLLFLIFVGEAGLAALVYLSSAITKKYDLLVFFVAYSLQFITSTIQGGYSDHYLRKHSLIIAINAVLIGQLFFLLSFSYQYMLIGTILFYGLLGNITPIARAALFDTDLKHNFRLSVGLSTIAISVGWVCMAFAAFYLHPFFACILVTSLCFLSNFFVWYLKDPKDRVIHPTFSFKNELFEISSMFKYPEMSWGLGGYLLSEVAFYEIFVYGDGQFNNPDVLFVVITWVLGYIIGAVSQNYIFLKNKEDLGMKWGVVISMLSIIMLIINKLYEFENLIFLILENVGFALGFGFFIPSLFFLISKKHKVHLQGKIYGLIDSTDSLALMIAVAIVRFPLNFSLLTLMIGTLILMILSIGCFYFMLKHSKTRHLA